MKKRIKTMLHLFDRLNLHQSYSMGDDGMVYKSLFPVMRFDTGDDFVCHVLFLACFLVKNNSRTGYDNLELFVRMCEFCKNLIAYKTVKENDDMLKAYLKRYDFMSEVRDKTFEYVKSVIAEVSECDSTGRREIKIKPFEEREAVKKVV